MSFREDFAENIVKVLKDMADPKPILVTRDPFDVEKLAITQFPAILVSTGLEVRADHSMGIYRQSTIQYTLRAFVRGGNNKNVDKLRNELIERIEETLDLDRTRGSDDSSTTTQVFQINIPERLPPLGEAVIQVNVRYRYKKGVV
jgi:hypothetical protein